MLLIVAATLISCTKEENPSSPDNGLSSESSYSKQDAYADFAAILSEAIPEEPALRAFIKKKATEMYDYDYDVFYPWVKNELVDGNRTFEDVLSSYDEEGKLPEILRALPKLTIMVPDWSWIGGAFGIDSWDETDPEVLIGTAGDEVGHDLYYKGKDVMHINDCEYLSCPVLIVKENERMKASAQTKSGDVLFDFAFPEYNNTISTRGADWDYKTINLYPEVLTDFVPLSDIDPELVNSVEKWREENIPTACQRDYFCYGMSKDNPDRGVFDNHIREQLYRFRLSPSLYYIIADQDTDPHLSDMKEYNGNKNLPTWQELKEMAWSDGAFEFNFQFYAGNEKSASALMVSPHFTVLGRNAFELTQVRENFRHQTWFKKGIYQFTFDPEDLISKWIYPETPYYLPEWDISSTSNNIFVNIFEIDGTEKKEYEKDVTYSYSHNFKTTFSGDYSGDNYKLSFGISSDNASQSIVKTTIKTEYTLGSDDLGLGKLEYMQKVLNSPETLNGVEGYSANGINIVGSVIITLLPRKISF